MSLMKQCLAVCSFCIAVSLAAVVQDLEPGEDSYFRDGRFFGGIILRTTKVKYFTSTETTDSYLVCVLKDKTAAAKCDFTRKKRRKRSIVALEKNLAPKLADTVKRSIEDMGISLDSILDAYVIENQHSHEIEKRDSDEDMDIEEEELVHRQNENFEGAHRKGKLFYNYITVSTEVTSTTTTTSTVTQGTVAIAKAYCDQPLLTSVVPGCP